MTKKSVLRLKAEAKFKKVDEAQKPTEKPEKAEEPKTATEKPKTATEAKSAPESHMQNLKALYPDKVRNNPKMRRAIDMRMKYQS